MILSAIARKYKVFLIYYKYKVSACSQWGLYGIVALTGEGGCPEQIRRRLQVTPNTASVSRTEAFLNIGIMSLSMTTNAAVILAAAWERA